MSLPDRYGKAGSDDSSAVVTNNFVVSIGILVAGLALGVMDHAAGLKTAPVYDFGSYVLDYLQQSAFLFYVAYGTLLLGVLSFVCGFIITSSGLLASKYPKCIYIAMFLLVLCGAANIAAGVMVNNGITLLNNAIYNRKATETEFAQNVTHFQLAMFNGCCAANGWSAEKLEKKDNDNKLSPDAVDTDGFIKYCDDLHPQNLERINESGSMRTCFKSAEKYYYYNYTVGQNLPRICKTLESKVNIKGKKIPGTNIEVSGFAGRNERIPIVGDNTDPVFGCGLGYGKAFQAAMLIWVENYLKPVRQMCLVSGSIYVVLVLLMFATFYACSREGQETAEERYARYLEEIHNSSSRGQVQDSFEHQNPSSVRMSVNQPMAPVHYSNRMSLQSAATHGSYSSNYMQPHQPSAEYQQSGMVAFNVDDKI